MNKTEKEIDSLIQFRFKVSIPFKIIKRLFHGKNKKHKIQDKQSKR